MTARGRKIGTAATGVALALLLAVVALPASPSTAKAGDHRSVTRAKRALRHLHYTDVTVRCKRRSGGALCHWTGMRAQERCRGALGVTTKRKHGRWVRVGRARCAATTAAVAPGDMPVGYNEFTTKVSVPRQLSTGATVRRMNIPWALVEKTPGTYNWRNFDDQYKGLLQAGLKPLIMGFTSPCWARPTNGCADLVYTGPPDPAFEPKWTDFMRHLAERYPKAIAIEVWSEPNLDAIFWPHADPVRYTRLLSEAYHAIKAVDPQMPVISGGMLTTDAEGSGTGGSADSTFLRAMYAAGAGDVMDGIGLHPYPSVTNPDGSRRWDPSVLEPRLQRLRAIRDAAGFHQPFWFTELGESTTTQAKFPAAVTPQQQATDIMQMYHTARADGDVRLFIIHRLTDGQADPGQALVGNLSGSLTGVSLSYGALDAGFGSFTSSGVPKPLACALSRELHGTLSC